ncbi:hypothetical protein R6Q57_016001 [Mikania cordata]
MHASDHDCYSIELFSEANSEIVLHVMISSKLLPEIEADDNAKREQLLHGMQNLSVPAQIEKLKARIDMIGAAFESAEKITSTLPAHLADVLPVGDSMQTISESSGMYMKNTPPVSSNAVNNQGTLMQVR